MGLTSRWERVKLRLLRKTKRQATIDFRQHLTDRSLTAGKQLAAPDRDSELCLLRRDVYWLLDLAIVQRLSPWGGAGYVAIRVFLAAILISAAVLKGYQLATGPVLGTGLFSSRILLIAVVEFEWLLGVWLITGLFPKWAWRVTLGCFVLFACVSLYKGLSGDASCGCFGQVEVSPWWTDRKSVV